MMQGRTGRVEFSCIESRVSAAREVAFYACNLSFGYMSRWERFHADHQGIPIHFRIQAGSTNRCQQLLGPLAELKGVWEGHGFNQIWRPFQGGPAKQDRFLELNQTNEILTFEEIPGDIPNRGLLQPDVNLHGLNYLQQVQDANVTGPNGELAGIHVEPGVWLAVPATTDPQDPTTVDRMANIPHGVSFTAQGTSLPPISGPPTIAAVSISPFPIGQPRNPIQFPETNLGELTPFRTDAGDVPNVTQTMVDDPNEVLRPGLEGASGEIRHQLQYSQVVLLNFNGLSWPHVSVAMLIKK